MTPPVRGPVRHILIIGSIIALALAFAIWSPGGIVLTPDGPALIVDATPLYRLGLERIRITSGDGCHVIVDVRDAERRLPNLIRLQAGQNLIEVPASESASFSLPSGRTYILTLCGADDRDRTGCRTRYLTASDGVLRLSEAQ